MVANTIPFNPMSTNNFIGSFSITSDGYVQGVAMDDPSIRNTLAGGVIATTETLPMIGGALIKESISGGLNIQNGTDTLGGAVARATTLAEATGISVLNQAHHWLTSPQSEAPVGFTGTSVHFHRFGSGARIPLAIDPALATALQGGSILQTAAWDFANQRLIAGTGFPGKIINLSLGNCKVIVVDPVTGGYHWNGNGSCALVLI